MCGRWACWIGYRYRVRNRDRTVSYGWYGFYGLESWGVGSNPYPPGSIRSQTSLGLEYLGVFASWREDGRWIGVGKRSHAKTQRREGNSRRQHVQDGGTVDAAGGRVEAVGQPATSPRWPTGGGGRLDRL